MYNILIYYNSITIVNRVVYYTRQYYKGVFNITIIRLIKLLGYIQKLGFMKFSDNTWKLMNVTEIENGFELSVTYPAINNLHYEITVTVVNYGLKVLAYRKDYHLLRGLTETYYISNGKITDQYDIDITKRIDGLSYRNIIADKIAPMVEV